MAIPTTNEELLLRWYKRLRETQMSHYNSAKPLSKLNSYLGVPVVILTTFVGTTVFTTLNKEVDVWIKVLVGMISVLAAVLSSIQTFLKYSDKAEKHRTIGAKAGNLRREIEQYIAQGDVNMIPTDKINSLRDNIDRLATDAPNVPDWIWNQTIKYLDANP